MYSLVSDFRELQIWKQARALALAGHELSGRLQHRSSSKSLSEGLFNLCVEVLTALVNQFEGNPADPHDVQGVSARDALAGLEELLSGAVSRGEISTRDRLLLDREIRQIKELL